MNLHYVNMKRKTKPLWERLVPIPLFLKSHKNSSVSIHKYMQHCKIPQMEMKAFHIF